MSRPVAGGATTSPSRDIMIRTASSDLAATETSAPEEPAILALPVELQKTIVEYLTSYRDMKSACLVCKQLNTLATPHLYRKMEVTGQFLRSDQFKTAITTRNPGLASVKTVRIVCSYSTSSQIGFGRAACLLLSTIPRNSITGFELPMPASPLVASEIFDCVRLKQRNVDNYQYDSVFNGCSEAFAADAEYRARVKHLRLRLWDARDREQAYTVLDSVHGLTSLNVDIRQIGVELHHVALELVFRALSKDHERSWIRSLRLGGVDFGQYGRPLPRLPGAQNLKHLQLAYCDTYGPFLQMLTALSTDLLTFNIEEGDYGSGGFDDDVNDFIRSLSSLERVSLTLDADFEQQHGLLDWSALHKCASVLRSLKLQYRCLLAPYTSDEDVLDFRRFCKNASSLEQLSISGIDLPMNENFGDAYIHGSLEQFLDCIQTAPALLVLKLTMWVSHNTVPLDRGASTEAYVKEGQDLAQRREHLVKRTADKILSTLASSCPRLKVVVIETTWEYSSAGFAVRAFLRSKQIDLYGHTTVVGMPVEPHMIKHYEPCSDVLESDVFVFA